MDRLSNYPGKTVHQTGPGNSGTTLCLCHQLATVAQCVMQRAADPPEYCCSLTGVLLQIHVSKTIEGAEKRHRGLTYGLSLCPPTTPSKTGHVAQLSLGVTM